MATSKPVRAVEICPGGIGLWRMREKHEIGKVVACFRCKAILGCTICCWPAWDLICGRCHDWGTKAALEMHGRMLPREKGADAMKIVMMIYEGKVTEQEGNKLFQDLFRERG